MLRTSLLLLLFLSLLMPHLTSAQWDNTDVRCTFSDGSQKFVRYQERQLILVDFSSGVESQRVDTGIEAAPYAVYRWLQGCTYVVVGLGAAEIQSLVVWNVAENRLVGQRGNALGFVPMDWSPDEMYGVIQSTEGGILWHISDGRQHIIAPPLNSSYGGDHIPRSVFKTYWDLPRNQLLAVHGDAINGVTATDLSTGQKVGFYHIDHRSGSVAYSFLADGNEMLVWSDTAHDKQTRSPYGMAWWDRGTNASVQLDIYPRRGYYGFARNERYFAIDQGSLYIWDLANLQTDETGVNQPNLIIQRGSNYWPLTQLRFRDTFLLEGRKAGGYEPGIAIFLWNVQTGERLYYSAVSETQCANNEFLATHPEPSLAAWGCALY